MPAGLALSRTARVLAAGLGGLACATAFPDPGWWWLAAPGVGALVLAVGGLRPRHGALLGLVHGLVFFVVLLRWAAVYVGPVAYALAVAEALFVAAFAALLVPVLRLGRRWSGWRALLLRAVAAGALWTGVEAVRSRAPFGGFGWGRLAFSQADAPTVALAALGGAPLVSFAVATAGAALALALVAAVIGRGRGAGGSGGRLRAPAAVAVPVALAVLLTWVGSLVPRPTAAEAGTLVVAAVQGDVPEPGLDFNAERRAVLDNHVDGTLRLADEVAAGRAPQPDVVIWPENASDIDPLANADAYERIDAAARAIGAPILVGTLRRGDPFPDDRLRNVVLVWDPEEGPTQVYAKRHPVPFAEYVPYRDFFRTFSDKVDLVRADMAPGERVGTLDVAGTTLGALICFEVIEDGLVDDVVDGGAEMLVVPTNNATFGFTDESVQQLAISRVRAVEEGRAVAHVSTVGVSALVQPDGSTGRTTELYTPDVLVSELPLRTTRTLSSHLGAWPEIALSALGALAVLAGARSGRRRRGPSGPPAGGEAVLVRGDATPEPAAAGSR